MDDIQIFQLSRKSNIAFVTHIKIEQNEWAKIIIRGMLFPKKFMDKFNAFGYKKYALFIEAELWKVDGKQARARTNLQIILYK